MRYSTFAGQDWFLVCEIGRVPATEFVLIRFGIFLFPMFRCPVIFILKLVTELTESDIPMSFRSLSCYD